MKRMLTIVLVVVMFSASSSLAETTFIPPANEISSNPNYSYVEWINPQTSNIGTYAVGADGLAITHATCGISKNGSSSILVIAKTETNIVSAPYVYVYVQQWKNNKWVTYATRSASGGQSTAANLITVVNVESGYYYRVRAAHQASTPYSTVTAPATVTQSILVN